MNTVTLGGTATINDLVSVALWRKGRVFQRI